MRDRSWNQHDIARSVAEDSVGDVDVAALGVFGFRFHGFLRLAPDTNRTPMAALQDSVPLLAHSNARVGRYGMVSGSFSRSRRRAATPLKP